MEILRKMNRKGQKMSLESRRKMSEARKKSWRDPEYKKRMSLKIKEGWNNLETRQKMSRSQKKLWEDPEYRKEKSLKNKESWGNLETRKKVSKSLKERWKDSEYIEKMSKVRKKVWKDPEYKKKMSNIHKNLWKNSDFRKKMEKTEEYREKISKTLTGRKLSEEHNKNIGNGCRGIKDSKEGRERKRIAGLGRKHSEKTKKKIGLASSIRQRKKNSFFGRKHSKESREKMSKSQSRSLRMKEDKLKFIQGHFYSRKNRKTFFFRSSYEFNALMKLEANPMVESFEMEYFKISYFFKGINRIYTPDFWVVMISGKEYIVEVKSDWVLKNLQVKAKARAAKKFCERNGMKFTFWTEKTLGRRMVA